MTPQTKLKTMLWITAVLLIMLAPAGQGILTPNSPTDSKTIPSNILQEYSEAKLKIELTIENLESAGIRSKKLEGMLEELNGKTAGGEIAIGYDRIKQIQLETLQTIERIAEINRRKLALSVKLNEAKQKGLNTEETERMITLSDAAFTRDDYATSLERIKLAERMEIMETKGAFSITYFMKKYWWEIPLILLGILLGGVIAYRQFAIQRTGHRISRLVSEEAEIRDLITDAQEKCFRQKRMSLPDYYKTMYQYDSRLERIRDALARLRTKKMPLESAQRTLDGMQNEKKSALQELERTQKQYFVEKTISRQRYETMGHETRKRIAEIEKSIQTVQIQQERHETEKPDREPAIDKMLGKIWKDLKTNVTFKNKKRGKK